MKNLTEVLLPIFWFTESFEIPHSISDELWIATNLPYIWLVIAILGFFLLLQVPIYELKREISSMF